MRVTLRMSGLAWKYLSPHRRRVGEVSDGMTCTHESHRGLGCVFDSVCGINYLGFYRPTVSAEEVALVQ